MNTSVQINKPVIIAIVLILLIVVIGALAFSLKLYLDTQSKLQTLTSPNQSILPSSSPSEVKSLLAKVEKHIILPSGEPKVITLSNVDVLKKDQPFFAIAKDGHKLLVYPNKVILYDPISDKVVDIATIRLEEKPTQSPKAKSSPKPTQITKKYNVLLLNGTDNDMDPSILEKLNERKDVSLQVRDAQNKDYDSNVVTNISDEGEIIASEIAESINATIFPIASREKITETDIDLVIIVGSTEN